LIVDAKGVIRSRHFEEDFRRRPTVGSILNEPSSPSGTFRNERVSVVTSASDGTVRGGERIRLFVQIELPKNMHVYAPGVSGYIPLQWKTPEGQQVEWLPTVFPPARTLHLKAIGEKVPVFERSFVLTRDVVVGQIRNNPKTLKLTGSLVVQACDDKKCYVPEEVPLSWDFAFEPHDSTRVPEELRRLK
jgi:DsbC/DsbD-like thiol-disulfide interchange protein